MLNDFLRVVEKVLVATSTELKKVRSMGRGQKELAKSRGKSQREAKRKAKENRKIATERVNKGLKAESVKKKLIKNGRSWKANRD